MQQKRCNESAALIDILERCSKNKNLHRGATVHAEIVARGLLGKNLFLASKLVSMYAKCGATKHAQLVVEALPVQNVVLWNAFISGCSKSGHDRETLNCFRQMQCEGVTPDAVTFACILKVCGSTRALELGESIHSEITKQGSLEGDDVLGGALMDMYAKCGALSEAKKILERLPSQDAVSWNTIITGYVQGQRCDIVFNCFEQMQNEGFSPDAVTFTCLLKACGNTGLLDKGKKLHNEIVRQQLLGADVVLGAVLVDMYAKCGALARAGEVLEELPVRDAVSFNSLISGYVQREYGNKALNCYEQMQHEGISTGPATLACILKACGILGAFDKGKKVHIKILRKDLLAKDVALGNALVDMYVKCGALAKAKEVLEGLPVQSVVSWSALIAGYVQGEHGNEALTSFEQMQREGFFPDVVTFACILKACGTMGALNKGENIHSEIVRQGLLYDAVVLEYALVDMYAKCGAVAKSKEVLEGLPAQDVVSWSALIMGYAQGVHSKEALKCFEQMKSEGLMPDEISFLCVLNACSHSGLVYEGLSYFRRMYLDYGIVPMPEHYTCLVKLLGCAGLLEQAIAVIKKMPSSAHSPAWFTLLSACTKWGNLKIGSCAFKHAVQ